VTLPSGTVTTEDEFGRRPDGLVVEALRHGVDITGTGRAGFHRSPPARPTSSRSLGRETETLATRPFQPRHRELPSREIAPHRGPVPIAPERGSSEAVPTAKRLYRRTTSHPVMSYVLQFVRNSEYPTTERQWALIWAAVTVSILVLVSASTGRGGESVLGALLAGSVTTVVLGVVTAGLVAVQRYDARRRAR
jgi:hypothetical protein